MPKVYETLYGWSRDDRLMHETRILEIKPPSTCIRIFLNPQLFLCGSGFLPHVSGESSSRRILNFLNPLSKEEIFEYVIIPESCGRSVWTVTRHHLLTGRGRGEEWPDGLGGGDVRHFRLVGAKSEYFLYSYVQASSLPWIFKTVPCITLSLLYPLHFSFKSYNVCAVKPTIRDSSSLRGRRLEGKGKGVLGARETRRLGRARGREGNACQETIVFLVFNIHQANVKILIGQSSKHVNHSVNTLIQLVEINITLLSNLIDLSVII